MKESSLTSHVYEALDCCPQGIFVLRADFSVVHWNGCLEDWTGISRGQIVGRPIFEFYPHFQQRVYLDRLTPLFDGAPPTVFSAQFHRHFLPIPLPEGGLRLQQAMATPILAAEDETSRYHVVCAIQDVTDTTRRVQEYRKMRDEAVAEVRERLLAESALRESQEILSSFYNSATMMMGVVELVGDDILHVSANPSAAHFFQATPETIRGRFVSQQEIFAAAREAWIQQYRNSQRTGQPVRFEHAHVSSGNCRWFSVTVCFTGRAASGNPRFSYVIEDITERKEAENERVRHIAELQEANRKIEQQAAIVSRQAIDLTHAKARAEEANRSKSAFLANMSHEIRTPMTAILGFADLLLVEGEKAITPEERTRHVRTIKRNGEYLLELINDILDLSKVESGNMSVACESFSLPDLVHDVIALMRVRADEKGVPLNVRFLRPCPATVVSDPVRIRQILINLLGNAIKFTQQGQVELRVDLFDADNVSPELCFQIVDSGIGISSEQLRTLFQPFCQADDSTSRQFGGTGLGLAISRRLAQLLGGTIDVDSTLGIGSNFRVTIRVVIPENTPLVVVSLPRREESDSTCSAPADRGVRFPGVHILLAEDGMDNQRLLAFHLRRAGAEFTIADNGELAIQLAVDAAERGQPFDLILMDMQMPKLDGYTATKQLRTRGIRGPIVAFTAHAMAGDREKCLEAGCDDYLTKPIHRQQLLDMLTKHLARTASNPLCAR
ncbi:MAG: ATP-binding protein [Planctomycetota bacterium]